VQVSLALFAIAYAVLMLRNSPATQDFYWLSYVFLGFCVVYLGFILVHNAPVFGTQSYFEFAPGYLVHKAGLFRPKQVFAAETMTMLELLPRQLRVRLQDGDIHVLNMREVKGTRRRAVLRGQLESFAKRYNVALREDDAATA